MALWCTVGRPAAVTTTPSSDTGEWEEGWAGHGTVGGARVGNSTEPVYLCCGSMIVNRTSLHAVKS